jgi:hypothetical protein
VSKRIGKTGRKWKRQLRREYRRDRGRHDRWSDGTPGRGALRRTLKAAMDGAMLMFRRSMSFSLWGNWGGAQGVTPQRYLGPGKGYE